MPKHHLRHTDMRLRVQTKNRGYLDVNSREYLFRGELAGRIDIEIRREPTVISLVRGTKLAVSKAGVVAVTALTALSDTLKPPFSIYLEPSANGEHRLIVTRIK